MTDDWQDPDRPVDVAALLTSLNEVKAFYAEHNALALEQIKKLNTVDERLASFVPRRRFRWVIGAVVVVIALLVAAAFYVRDQDATRDREREAAIEREAELARHHSIEGCGRANDARATLREVIEESVVPRPPPPGLSAELTELFLQAQANTAALRERLLSLPGVQRVDCEAEYPAPKRGET